MLWIDVLTVKWALWGLQEYMQKAIRGSAMGNHKPLSFFYSIDRQVRGIEPFPCQQSLRFPTILLWHDAAVR